MKNNERAINGSIQMVLFKEKKIRNLVLFHEYFHGDNLRGLGASHQTGWTALITNLFYNLDNKSMI